MNPLSRVLNLKLSQFGAPIRFGSKYKTKLYLKTAELGDASDDLIKKVAPKLIYNSVIQAKIFRHKLWVNKKEAAYDNEEPIPVALSFLDDFQEKPNEQFSGKEEKEFVNFPYNFHHNVEFSSSEPEQETDKKLDIATKLRQEVEERRNELQNWMSSYDNYNDLETENMAEDGVWRINYGKPDRKAKMSNIPCGGCGALLHCNDTAIPGYIPSEIFKNSFVKGGTSLNAIVCQRCHFLNNYNVALQVQVKPEEYPRVLQTISNRHGLVILMVDLLDFPCSIWPGIGEIFGNKIPMVIVGNKVDLLPQDSPNFLKTIKSSLLKSVKLEGFATFNIKEVALISAKTGYGIENLITNLNSLYDSTGDIYIVGCTNVGKSSLFNAFLQSDLCKFQALDLIQRATTSVWPGTTLNLLKFPIKRPAGYRQYLRQKRLQLMEKIQKEERILRKQQLKETNQESYASLIGHIGITKSPYSYSKDDDKVIVSKTSEIGINEKSRAYIHSKWCYDTPGVVQPDQIIHLLTTHELLSTLPKSLVIPRTFCLQPKSSLFIAGLARLDFLSGDSSVKLAVFASKDLPITVCELDDAQFIYQTLLGSELFRVPEGNEERLKQWPQLEMGKEFQILGDDLNECVTDVVLSSAGWIAIAGKCNHKYAFQAWTPEKRGIYLRDCLLPFAVARCRRRMNNSVAYEKFKFYTE